MTNTNDKRCEYCKGLLYHIRDADMLICGVSDIYSCTNSRYHSKGKLFICCKLCSDFYDCDSLSWVNIIIKIKHHLQREHKIHSNNYRYESVGKDEYHGIGTSDGVVHFILPNFISIFMQSNVSDLLKYTNGELVIRFDQNVVYRDVIANLPFEWLNFTCTICEGEFDSISKDICEEHIRVCISAHNSK